MHVASRTACRREIHFWFTQVAFTARLVQRAAIRHTCSFQRIQPIVFQTVIFGEICFEISISSTILVALHATNGYHVQDYPVQGTVSYFERVNKR